MADVSQFPGLAEVLEHLAKERMRTGNAPVGPMTKRVAGATVPTSEAANAVQRGGDFNVKPGSGAGFLKGIAGKLAGVAPVVSALASPAWALGAKAGHAANKAVGYEDASGRPIGDNPTGGRASAMARNNMAVTDLSDIDKLLGYSAQPPVKTRSLHAPPEPVAQASLQPVAEQPVKQQASQAVESAKLAGLDPVDYAALDEEGVDTTESTPTAQPVQVAQAAQVAQAQPRDKLMQLMETLINQSSAREPVQELPNEANEKTIKDASTPKVQPKETFGHKVKRFIVAGSGPVDFSRIDKQEAEANQAQQQFTDPERFKANVASGEKSGAQAFNRQSQLDQQRTGGMTPQMKFMLDLVSGDRDASTKLAGQKELLGVEHGSRMKEIGASGANQRLTPEMQQTQLRNSIMEKNPDLFSAQDISTATGLTVSPEALKILQDARLKNDPMAMMVTEMLKERLGKMGSGRQNPAQITTKALQGVK